MNRQPARTGRRARDEDYETLVRLSEELLGVVALDGRLELRNPAWERKFDFSRAEPRTPEFLSIIHPDDRDRMRRAIRWAVRGDDVPPVEARCFDRAGGERLISWKLAAAAGKRRCRVVGRDAATAQDQRGERKLAELGLVAAVVAHDFNNVLSIIRGCASMLRIIPGLSPAQGRELDDLSGGVRHGTELVQQVFAHSRQKPPQAGDVDLNKVIVQMGWMLRRLGRKNIGVDLVLARDLGHIMAEEVQVEQVVFNLALNARDAMPEGGRLLIETSDVLPDTACAPPLPPTASGGYVRLVVSDTGNGISPEVQARLFEPFFTTKRNGTGMGLFSVQQILQQCRGHIRVRSLPHKGTTFEAYFPRADTPAGRIPL